tara:strand:- start:3139 stop:4728 length:1590 start_codon:yes stop_codon:yes gene_type:complete
MTRADVVQRLWDFINSSPAKDGAGATIINAEARSILEACNASIQEIAHYASRDFFKQTRSSVLRAPLSASIDVTEDSKSFTNLVKYSVAEAKTNSGLGTDTIIIPTHTLIVGDRIKFTGTIPADLKSHLTYYVKEIGANAGLGNWVKLSLTSGGSAVTVSQTATGISYSLLLSNLPEGCSIEIGGSDEVTRINEIKNEVDPTPVSIAIYSGTSKTVFLDDTKDPESWQSTLEVGDTVAFVDAVPASSPTLSVGTSYFVTQISALDGIGSTSGADTYKRYIRLGQSAGTSDINISASSGTFSMVKTTSGGNDAQGTLHEEYLGTTGTKSCTIYYDAIELKTKVTEVLGTVVLNDESVLTPLMNNDQSSRMHRDRLDQSERFGEYGSGWELPSELQDKKGTPSYYYIDSEHNEATNGQNYYLRVRPFPEKKARLRFTASVLPEKWVISDTYSNTGQAKDTGCPAEYDETILMPFVYKNFTKFIGFDVLPSEGSLQSGNILLQIDEDYRQAIEILKELEPQSERQAVYGVAW